MWIIEEMLAHGIDFQRCPIGIVPFGTGNDFSIALGWGKKQSSRKFFGKKCRILRRLVL